MYVSAQKGKKMPWKIGEIIKRTGLTARTLHFYEEQGLIGPISRNSSGHRIYLSSDLVKLQQIVCLRSLGIPVSSISNLVLDEANLITQLKNHLKALQEKKKAIEDVEKKISSLIEAVASKASKPGCLDEILFKTLESISMYEKYFEKAQQDEIHRRNTDEAWQSWIASMKMAIEDGLKPESKEVQKLMSQWQTMISKMLENDSKKSKTFYDMLHNEPKARHDHGIDAALFEFMGKAIGKH
jgi:DNA-binding transcriptional MerR regulator